MGAPCLVPNPTAEPALVRGWELECQPDAWMVPRWEVVVVMVMMIIGTLEGDNWTASLMLGWYRGGRWWW